MLHQSGLTVQDLWTILENASNGLFYWDPASDRVAWSARFMRTLGYDPGDAAGLADIAQILHPDDRDRHARVLEQSIQDHAPYKIDLRMQRRDGSYADLAAQGFWFERPGGDWVLMGVAHDITEWAVERDTAKLFRSFIENAPAAAFIKDGTGAYVYANEPAAAYADSSMAEFVGKPADAIFPDHVAEQLARTDRTVRESGQPVSYQADLETTDGARRQIYTTKFPLRDPRTGADLIGGMGIDVSRQVAAEQALAQSQKREALGQLVAGIAHDFNNTLAVLRGNLELLEIAQSPAERAECLSEALGAVDRGARLTQQLLAYGRKAVLRKAVEPINTIVAGVERLLRRTLPETIAIETVLDDAAGNAELDRGQLENALLNLALNARDAMPQGGVLTLRTARIGIGSGDPSGAEDDLRPGEYIALSVTDTGTGMEPDIVARAFDPFFSTKPFDQGAGMGLSMVFGLSKQFGGTARIASTRGVGTTVTLYIPAVAEAAETPVAQTCGATPGTGHILLVEDEAGVRRTLGRQLATLGYRVTEATTGSEGLDRLAADRSIDLVLSDIVMPGTVQGSDLARTARERWPDVPVLFISGYPLAAATEEGGLAPADVTLSKPVALGELSRAIRDALGQG